uniref:E2F transcription factor 2 n=1 Tax=Anser brachyrhynchus TaxID=132585 RepID=A0A8B9BKI8_9AVES
MGTGIFEDAAVAAKQQALRGELAELAKAERALEQLLQDCALWGRPALGPAFSYTSSLPTLAYVTYQDLCTISNFQEQTVIAVKAPPETRLEVPDFSEDNLQLYLKSTNGPIEVYLCPEEIAEDSPTKQHGVPSAATPPPPGGPGSLLEVGTGLLGSPQHLLQQTEDQLPCAPSYLDSAPFVTFSPPLEQDDYLWGLEDGKGVSDLFEAYDLGELLKN